jgi:flagellar secretion chaperone FliS
MSSHFNSSGYGYSGGQEYLDANIQTASPARLRLMLIERGVEVAQQISNAWRESKKVGGQDLSGPNEYTLKLLDIINELLNGVTGDKIEVCRKVADLYVFLAKHLIMAEEKSDASAIDEIRLVLETEAETWRMVCVNEYSGAHSVKMASPGEESTGRLNLQA